MTTLTMGSQAGEHLVSEFDPSHNREAVTVLSGQNLDAGQVIGRITKALSAAPIPTIVGTGTGLMSALTCGPDVQTGNYVITLLATSATAAFSVVAPDGTVLPNGAVGTAYTSRHVSFLVSNGGTMTEGDSYTIAVTAGGTPVLVGTGTGAVSGLSLGPDAMNGAYRVQLLATSATAEFEVIAPDGTKLKRGQVATAYASSHINFTLANAGTMTSGDYFIAVVAKGSQKVVTLAPGTYDGRHVAYGVLHDAVDASAADAAGVALVRGPAIVESAALDWGSLTTAEQASAKQQLAAAGIVCR